MLNLNYNLNAAGLEKARFTEQENEAFRPFQIQYVIVPAGGGAAAGNNSFNSGSDLPKVGIAGNGGVIASGSYCVQPLTAYPIVIGKGGKGGIKGITTAFTGSTGGNSAFYNIEAMGGDGGKSQIYITSSTFAGNGLLTSASGANGGTGSQWTYNLPGCLPDPFNPGCHGGQLISESYYSGGGAGIVVSGSSFPALEIEYIVVGGGGGGMNNTNTCNNGIALAGGGGAAITGSFIAEPIVKTYPISVGAGGIGVYACLVEQAYDGTGSAAFGVLAGGGQRANSLWNNGNSGTGSWGLTTPFLGQTSTNSAAGFNGSGAAGAAQNGSGSNGGSGLQWVDGNYYAGGGGSETNEGNTTLQFGYYPGRGGTAKGGNQYNIATNGKSGSVVVRYSGTGSKATGGQIYYTDGYTYHFFSQSGDFVLNENTSSLFTSGLAGVGAANALFSPSGSLTPIPNTGGGAGATYYNQNGVSGSDGFVAIRYEGAPIAEGGNIVVTDYYTYHLFSSSGDFYVVGNETNPNINPCA